MLRFQVLGALRRLAVLVDRGQVDRFQPAHARVDLGDGLLPFTRVGHFRQGVDDVLDDEAGGDNPL